jgi:hypothetical protein
LFGRWIVWKRKDEDRLTRASSSTCLPSCILFI